MASSAEDYSHSDTRASDNSEVTEQQLRDVLAKNVQRRMEALELVQEALEARAGLGQSTVSRILNKGGSATLKSLAALAEALACQPWELLVDDDATREAALRKILAG